MAVKAPSPNHGTTRDPPGPLLIKTSQTPFRETGRGGERKEAQPGSLGAEAGAAVAVGQGIPDPSLGTRKCREALGGPRLAGPPGM